MGTKIKFKRGTKALVDAITPEEGEPVWITDDEELVIGDGVTEGGKPAHGGEIHLTPKASSSGPEGTIFYDSDDDHVYVGTE